MKRLAVAVLLTIFLLSSTLPVAAAPLNTALHFTLNEENPGLGDEVGSFDDFSFTFTVGRNPISHVVAFLNNDSRPDIAIIYDNSSILDIFFCDTQYKFSSANRTSVNLTSPLTAIAAGDMDKDGKMDLVVTRNSTNNNVVILFQEGGFTVSTVFSTVLRPHEVALKDLDGDTWLDVVTLFSRDALPYDPGIRIHFHSDGYGFGGVQINLGSTFFDMRMPRLFKLGDFNGDGRTDIIVGDHDVGKVVGFINGAVSGLTWNPTNPFNIAGPTAILLEQLDDTGNPELVVGTDLASKIEFRSFSSGSFSLYTELQGELRTTSLASIFNDATSRSDLVRASAQYHNVTIFRTPSIGQYSYSNAISFPTPYYPVGVKVTDMNLDGASDLVLISRSSVGNGTASIYYRSTVVISNANDNQIVKDIVPGSSIIGDFNGDDSNELAVYDPTQSKIRFVKEGVPDLMEKTAPANISTLECADLNDDGFDDLILIILNPASFRVWFGGSTFLGGGGSQVTITSSLQSAMSVTTGDLNDDGRTDVAVGGVGGVDLFWSSGSGTLYTNVDHQFLALAGVIASSMTCGQLAIHNDGLMDIALVNANESRIEIYYQQPGPTKFVQGERQLLNMLETIGEVSASDMNSDGSDDLVTSTSTLLHIYLQSSSFPKGFSEGQDMQVTSIPEGVGSFRIGDLDDDGGSELAVVTRNSTIMAYEFEYPNFVLMTRQSVGASPVMLLVDDMNDDIKDDLIAYSTLSRTVSFFYQNNFPPTASWIVAPGEHREGISITFNGSSSFDSVSDQALLTYNWNFGNGQSRSGGYGPYFNYSYPDNGTFTVTLVVTDQGGLEDSFSGQITIGDVGPSAGLSYSGTTLTEGQPVQFNDLSTSYPDDIVNWHWDFGDGQTSNLQNPQHTYAGNGVYDVGLTVTDEDGSTDNVAINVTVNDSVPVSIFQIDAPSPLEKQVIQFTDRSTFTADNITSWYWTFGDGGSSTSKDPAHAYQDNGTYLITLVVTDTDGSTRPSNQTLIVADSSPSVTGLSTNDGQHTYNEWDEVRFVVNATATQDGITGYQWDFQTYSFQVDSETSFNTVSHRYELSGSYLVTVRVWDADSYSETSFILLINDPAPLADFTFTPTQNAGQVSFSAALSSDTENDQGILQYRWNFEGAWTTWNTSYEIDHVFNRDGVFAVKLEVKDDHNTPVSKSRNVTIDLLPPIISITDPVLKAEVGRSIVIYASVTDVVGVESVLLEYTVDNVTRTVIMTLEAPGEYFGQIPARNHSTEITYRIIAEDRAGHFAYTDPFVISVEFEDSALFMLSSALLLLTLLGLLIYLFLSRPIVDEIFVMYHDGTLLAHQTRRLKPGMDDEILGGMLIALQNFVRDSFKDESSTVLSRMDFGERKILVERKEDFFLAVLLSGKRPGSAPQRMQRVLDNIEDNYAEVLREWDGDLEKVRGIRDDTKPMFQRANPLDRLKHREDEEGPV